MWRCHRLLRYIPGLNAHLLSAVWTLTLLQFYHPALLPLPCARMQIPFSEAPSSVASLSKKTKEIICSISREMKKKAGEREMLNSQQELA